MANYPVTLANGSKAESKLLLFVYDFAVNAGAIGNLVLGPDSIPVGWYVTDINAVVETALVSGGAATVALGAVANGDLVAAAAYTGYTVDTSVNYHPAASPKKTVAGGLRMTIAGATLTAGKVKFFVEIKKLAA
jgi:hypothetical protein